MPKKLIEAALFMSPRPLTVEDISKITGVSSLGKIEERLEELRKEYEGKGIEIIRSPEGWVMQVKNEMLPRVAHLARYSDLRDGHKRTLALVAYREPVKQSEIVRIQGNKSYAYIKLLIKKGLIKSEKEGRTRILTLTREFERYFGEEKERIREMLEQGVKQREEGSVTNENATIEKD
ncbi:MAG: SMC-Scp complex subunit ScpB [Candidatus Aenigmarchaeota archaeon]|nr:SMC-Scp complex subunit ScpB [Candidatus Aenigmarchaeota archaeon]